MAEAFRQVGEFIDHGRRHLIRSLKNPIDKSTVVSIFPKDIVEVKHTIEPGIFKLLAGSFERPSLLIVGTSSWWKDVDIEQPMLEIPVSSIQIANSIIHDYCNGLLGCNMSTAMPGLFFIPGELSVIKVMADYKERLLEAKVKQENWFRVLVNLADSLWARSNGNPLVIWDIMRIGAKALNEDKPWLREFEAAKMVACVACGAMRNPLYPVCPMCKNIDKDHPMAKDLKFAL